MISTAGKRSIYCFSHIPSSVSRALWEEVFTFGKLRYHIESQYDLIWFTLLHKLFHCNCKPWWSFYTDVVCIIIS